MVKPFQADRAFEAIGKVPAWSAGAFRAVVAARGVRAPTELPPGRGPRRRQRAVVNEPLPAVEPRWPPRPTIAADDEVWVLS